METRLVVNPQDKADNRLYRSEATPYAQSAPVQLRTIDAILVDLGIHTIDILKIDAQGSEFSAITGAANSIRNSPGMMLLSEFWPDGMRQAGRAPERYLELLRDLGLTLFELKRIELCRSHPTRHPPHRSPLPESNRDRQDLILH